MRVDLEKGPDLPLRNCYGQGPSHALSTEASDYLDSPEVIEAYLEAAFETNDVALFSVAMGDGAKAKGMGGIATKSGLSKESLYRALSAKGNPTFDTVLRALNAVGVTLTPKIRTH
ncbi:MAG: putative addiction module antidote protein [Aestuariivita sp.]|nr:putative addiction module antidote protein [Aestuariivita sp.]MCY4202487.1 putative addiction module antidote protein [Aestuariivita sp.]